MQLKVDRKELRLYGNAKRVIARFFFSGQDRAGKLMERILAMSEEELNETLQRVRDSFSWRHRDFESILLRNFNLIRQHLPDMQDALDAMSPDRKLLTGAYFTHEYAIEAAAFFNPSIVEAPDQSGLPPGHRRFILSLRAVGEGHISSIILRELIIDADGEFHAGPTGDWVGVADEVHIEQYDKKKYRKRLRAADISPELIQLVADQLPEKFTFKELYEAAMKVFDAGDYSSLPSTPVRDSSGVPVDHAGHYVSSPAMTLERVLESIDCIYEFRYTPDTEISERVIFPAMDDEFKGLEDVRFVEFTKDTGERVYYGTFIAYSGISIRPKLIMTKDFLHFKVKPLYGRGAHNKNQALFPRKINGQYAMLARIDGVNNYICFSDSLHHWGNPQLLEEPAHPWEYYQVGNCGSPIETAAGWLVITHGVGPMRQYALGAMLLDLENPLRLIGRTSKPLLLPNETEREGYVPNVVYSCGCIIHGGQLIVPYGMSDHAAGFFSIELESLLEELIKTGKEELTYTGT